MSGARQRAAGDRPVAESSRANQQAEDILNGYAAAPFANLVPATTTLDPIRLEDGTVVTARVEIRKGDPPLADVLRHITVTLQWRDRQKLQVLVRHRRLSRLQR